MSAQKLGCRLKSWLQKEIIFVAMFISTTNNILYNMLILHSIDIVIFQTLLGMIFMNIAFYLFCCWCLVENEIAQITVTEFLKDP